MNFDLGDIVNIAQVKGKQVNITNGIASGKMQSAQPISL